MTLIQGTIEMHESLKPSESAFACVPRHLVEKLVDLERQVQKSPYNVELASELASARSELIKAAKDDIAA